MNSKYEIFLLDNNNYTKLDCDEVDMAITFALADIKNLSVRKDNITKQLKFYGTKNNNTALGTLFYLNKTTDTTLSNKLFFNLNPLRAVDTLVYEDGMLLLKGNMRVIGVKVTDGNVIYNTIITGKIMEFNNIIQSKLLTDLDLSDLKHEYKVETIRNSWNIETQVAGATEGTFIVKPFNMGDNYIYPYLDYGTNFLIDDNDASNYDTSKFNGLNFRPALFVNEYMKRIFAQPELEGWTYDIAPIPSQDPLWNKQWYSLIVPNNDERLQYNFNGGQMEFKTPVIVTDAKSINYKDFAQSFIGLNITSYANPLPGFIAPFIKTKAGSNCILVVNRNLKADIKVNVELNSIVNTNNRDYTFRIQLIERTIADNDYINTDDWKVVTETTFVAKKSSTTSTKSIVINSSDVELHRNTNLAIRIQIDFSALSGNTLSFNATYASLSVPKNETTPFTADLQFSDDGINYDIITPSAPANVKQIDFIKSIMSLFNLYAYTEKSNPKKLIFATYDNFHVYSNPDLIRENSIDWTNKIDDNNYEIISNLSIPKNYIFTYKDDNDFINEGYKKKWNKAFGTFEFTDELGIVESKKIELIFSPTPIAEVVGTLRKTALLFKGDLKKKEMTATNIRLMHYNGLKQCQPYTVNTDYFNNSTKLWETKEIMTSFNYYPQTTTYYFDEANKPISDLSFGRSKEYFFLTSSDYVNVETAYSFYRNQTTELTNVNIFTLEGDFLLNEIDITNLDLKKPIFINLGKYGHSYFKVLSIEYLNNNTVSKVVLQKIYLGTLS